MENIKTNKKEDSKLITNLLNLDILLILLLLIQSCGIKFFNGQSSLLAVIIIVFSIKNLKFFNYKDFKYILLILIFLLINIIINPYTYSFESTVYQIILIVESYILLLRYRYSNSLLRDLQQALMIILVYSSLSYASYFIFSTQFHSFLTANYSYITLYNIFYLTDYSDGWPRNVGIFWEPGLLQLMLNILLFISIKNYRSIWILSWITIIIISCFSTAGFVTLLVNLIYYIIKNYRKNPSVLLFTVISLVFISSSFLFIWENISDKFGGENLSGLARYRDFLVGIDLISEKPFLGHGQFNQQYVSNKSYVTHIETQLFPEFYNQTVSNMEAGFTNGVLSFASWYGLPIFFLTFYLFFRNKILVSENKYEKLLFSVIVIGTLLSEPITYTPFFLIFPFSTLIINNFDTNHFKVTIANNLKR